MRRSNLKSKVERTIQEELAIYRYSVSVELWFLASTSLSLFSCSCMMNMYLSVVILAVVLPISLGQIFKIRFPRPEGLAEVTVISSQPDVENSLSIFVRESGSYMKHAYTLVVQDQHRYPQSANHKYTLDAPTSSHIEFLIEVYHIVFMPSVSN